MLTANLQAAYRATSYLVHDGPTTCVLRIGRSAKPLHRHLGHPRACAVLTAFNPGSQRLCAADNARRHARLCDRVRALRIAHLPAVGQADAADWPAEHGLLLIGIHLAQADALARDFGQLAFVWVSVSAEVRLVGSVLRD